MTTHKTSELDGGLLDAAVALAEGLTPFNHERGGRCWIEGTVIYEPSTDWAIGGPIIERKRIDLINNCSREKEFDWMASATCPRLRIAIAYGPTPLIAAMRVHVESKFGHKIAL